MTPEVLCKFRLQMAINLFQEEKAQKEEEEAKRKADDDAKKKKILSSFQFTGFMQRVMSSEVKGQRCTTTTNASFLFCFDWQTDKKGGPRKQTEREKKKTILSERRKELNVENLSADKLRWKKLKKHQCQHEI